MWPYILIKCLMPLNVSVCLSVCLSIISLSIYLYIYLSICPSVRPSIYPSVSLSSIHLSIGYCLVSIWLVASLHLLPGYYQGSFQGALISCWGIFGGCLLALSIETKQKNKQTNQSVCLLSDRCLQCYSNHSAPSKGHLATCSGLPSVVLLVLQGPPSLSLSAIYNAFRSTQQMQEMYYSHMSPARTINLLGRPCHKFFQMFRKISLYPLPMFLRSDSVLL